MPVLLQLVHGYPPHQVAGTEVYAARLTEALRRRGWTVHVIAAHRAPGLRHGAVIEEPAAGGLVARVVNNLPWRPLARGERDPLVEGPVQALIDRLQPDLVHVQHLLFLGSGLRLPAPALGTLHDAWGWCARGGTLLRDGVAPCPGPEPAACARCYDGWARGAAAEHGLARAAGLASRVVAPEHLHRAWRRLPAGVRGLTRRGPASHTTPEAVTARQQAVAEAWRRLDARVAPSRWLAARAEAEGLGPTAHLLHGVAPSPGPATARGPLIFLGSLVPHKGAHLVVEAWERAGRPAPLRLVGPETDPAYAARLPAELRAGPVPPEEVPALLRSARALVMGSTWPENSPLVVLEARAAGCPVVAPAVGGIPELIEDGIDGRLVPPGDVGALAAALSEVVSRPWSAVRAPPTFDDHLAALVALYRALRPW